MPSDSPQGDTKTSIVLPGEESVETTQKNIRCDGGSTDINNNGVERRGELKYILKYLVQFVLDAKPEKKEQTVRISGARVLTSDKCASILKECEEKKQKEKEEKEKRRSLREQKKKEREEELEKKKAAGAEKRAAAAEKRAAAARKKAEVAEKRLKKKQTSVSTLSIEASSESVEAQVTRKWPSRTYILREKRVRCDALDLDGPSNLSGIVVTTAGNTSKMVL